MTKKLKILGPYTPEHPGPFCTRDGRPVDLRMKDGRGYYPLLGYIGDSVSTSYWMVDGGFIEGRPGPNDLMNAEEVPVAREFWVNEYQHGLSEKLHRTEKSAKTNEWGSNLIRTIHLREVFHEDVESPNTPTVSGVIGVVSANEPSISAHTRPGVTYDLEWAAVDEERKRLADLIEKAKPDIIEAPRKEITEGGFHRIEGLDMALRIIRGDAK